ncbi:hypothetical protein D0726_004054 [Escherichia coli]|nr:hypothetical protein [Escherichia coli]
MNNTYVKIVNEGMANHVQDLMPFMSGEELIRLPEDESVEVRSSVFQEGNIIIFRNRQREVTQVIHTPHTVYVQELNKTIGTHRPYCPYLQGVESDGSMVLEDGYKDDLLSLPPEFFEKASPLCSKFCSDVIAVFNALPNEVILAALEFDQFNVKSMTNFGLEEAFGIFNEYLMNTLGINVLPIKFGNGPEAVSYYCVEKVGYISDFSSDDDEANIADKLQDMFDKNY